MEKKESTQLVSYLKKEVKRLSKAVAKAEQDGRYGRVTNLLTSFHAYQRFLDNIFKDVKKPFLLIAPVMFSIFTRLASAEVHTTQVLANEMLSGKIFEIKFSGKNALAANTGEGLLRLWFKGEKMHFQQWSKDYYYFAKFPASFFYATVDSTQGGMILFSSQTRNKKGETLLWFGSVAEDKITGTLVYTHGSSTKLYHFSGTLRYVNSSEGKF